MSSIPGLGRLRGERNGYSPQYSCLENSIEEPGRLQSMGSQGVRHDWATSTSQHKPNCVNLFPRRPADKCQGETAEHKLKVVETNFIWYSCSRVRSWAQLLMQQRQPKSCDRVRGWKVTKRNIKEREIIAKLAQQDPAEDRLEHQGMRNLIREQAEEMTHQNPCQDWASKDRHQRPRLRPCREAPGPSQVWSGRESLVMGEPRGIPSHLASLPSARGSTHSVLCPSMSCGT